MATTRTPQQATPLPDANLEKGGADPLQETSLKRVPLIYAFLSSFLVAISLSACGLQTPLEPDTTLSTQSAAPEMRVRSVSLSSDSRSWLSEVKGTTNYRSKSSTYSLERLAGSGRVQDLSRHLNLQLTSVLAAFRVSGDRDLLEKVYVVMQKERATLKDTNRDGYLDWRYVPGAKSSGSLDWTDKHVMEEIMAHSIVAQAAYAFKLNSRVDRKYAEAASFWTNYLQKHYEAKWRKRTGKRSGYPIIEKPLFHPYVNNTRYHHYMYKLTGNSAYRQERDREVALIKRHLLPTNGAYVWTHFVNEAKSARGSKLNWSYQPVGYTGEAMSVLADLGLEGVLSESTMRGIAKTLAVKMLDDGSKGVMAGDVGGSQKGSYYIPYLHKKMTLTAPGYSRGTIGTFSSRGYALLAPWDSSGEIARKAASCHKTSGGWPIAPAGVVLAKGFRP